MITEELTLLDNIKDLYDKVGVKHKYIDALSVHINKSPRTVQRHYFSKDWIIPEKLWQPIVDFTQKYIANLKK